MINLNWKTIVATTIMTTAALPLAGASFAPPSCSPQADGSAQELPGTPTTYLREYSIGNAIHAELWEETNHVAGLQPDSTWNCGAAGDTLLQSTCYGCFTQL